MDASWRDGGRPGCGANELCVEGRCHARCTSDADCGPREMCGAAGACVRSTRDAGMTDAGPPDPCADVACSAPQVCNPGTRTCVDCTESTVGASPGQPGSCSRFEPVCDIANGRCRPLSPGQCLPCNTAEDCVAPDASFSGLCVLREVLDVREQVCMIPCSPEGTCADGLACVTTRDEATGLDLAVCVPPIEMPCTSWLAGISARECMDDGDCAALGASRARYLGACAGADPSGEPPVAGSCQQPCGETTHCFRADLGEQCLGEGIELFCRP